LLSILAIRNANFANGCITARAWLVLTSAVSPWLRLLETNFGLEERREITPEDGCVVLLYFVL
jgi:hypothetical protein